MRLTRRSDLAFVVGLQKVFHNPQSALDYLDRETQGLGSSLLHDLRVLALIETGRLEAAATAVEAAQAGSWQDLELDPMCFRAYRQLRLLEAFRVNRPGVVPPGGDAQAMLGRLEPLASAVGANRGLLRATLGLVRMAAGQYRGASAEFEALIENVSPEEGRISLLHQALCLSLHDESSGGFELAAGIAREAHPDLSAYLWLSRESAGRSSESTVVAERWFLLGGAVWREHSWSDESRRERAIVFGHALMIRAIVTGRASSLRPIGAVMRSERRSGLSVAGQAALDEVRRLYSWTGVWEAEAARRSGESEQVEEAVRFTRRCVAEFIADSGGKDFELRVAVALAEAERALVFQQDEMCDPAILELEGLVSEGEQMSLVGAEASALQQTQALLESKLGALRSASN